MSYVQNRPMADLFPVAATRVAAREMTRVAGEFYFEQVRELTPVYHGPASLEERGGRQPGTARDSVKVGPVLDIPGGHSITVFSDDPVMEYIEYDTEPHLILPVHAQALRWMTSSGQRAFAASVNHPGTTGQHMFSIAAVATEAEFVVLADAVLHAWEASTLEPALA